MTKQMILQYFCDINMVYNDSSKYDSLAKMIDELLEDRPELVRCKDCKWRGIEYGYTKGWCEKNHGSFLDEDFFCADGERREDGAG